MPTHPDKPEGFDEVAARRSAEVEAAGERARASREAEWTVRVREQDAARAVRSVPPPPRA